MPPRIPDVVKNLLILNVLFFLAGLFLDTKFLALRFPLSDDFLPVQLATHFFMHAGLGHIFFNMFALVMFGSALEILWGPKRFLFFYFACAFGAAGLHMLYSWYEISQIQDLIDQFAQSPTVDTYWAFFQEVPLQAFAKAGGENAQYAAAVERVPELLRSSPAAAQVEGMRLMNEYLRFKMDIPVVGASGAVYGLLLGFGMQFPNVELMLIFLPIPIKAKYFIPVLMLIELFLGVNQFSWDNIAHFAHLGGAVTGFLLILYWRKFGTRL